MILEGILSEIGDAGRFQVIFTAIITTMEIVIAWNMLQVIFFLNCFLYGVGRRGRGTVNPLL